ncbi:MAG: NAD(+) synthase [Anaerorhabdus sp.]
MKVVLGQIRVVAGDIDQNMKSIKTMVQTAKEQQADLIIFPEMTITGYCIGDKYYDPFFIERAMTCNDEIRLLSQNIGILYGNIYTDSKSKGKDGRVAQYNASYFFQDQKEVIRADGKKCTYFKHLLPNYRIFDDSRYFLSGLDKAQDDGKVHDCSPFLFSVNGKIKKIGVEICEDLWSENYPLDITQYYLDQEVDYIINISASPWTLNKEKSRVKQIKRYINGTAKTKFIYVNCVGMQNTGKNICLFDGGSAVYDDEGNLQISANDQFEEECAYVTYDKAISTNCNHKLLNALIMACKEVDEQWFNKKFKWVVGLSGGLDSSITAALLVAALGSDRVIGYNMATQHNSDKTKNNARHLAKELNIDFREGGIADLVSSTVKTTETYGYQGANMGLTLENIQARIRGHLLSTFAALENGVVVNNGNKVEVALGYCTMYGDSIGVFSPLGDCTKVQLFDLALEINNYFKKEVVPTVLLPKKQDNTIQWTVPPSAELKEKQVDPMKWYYHDWLISKLVEYPGWTTQSIIEAYEDKSLFETEIGEWLTYYGLDDPDLFYSDLKWIVETMNKAIFKRIQMPPIVLVSRGGFGSDFREVQGLKIENIEYFEKAKNSF